MSYADGLTLDQLRVLLAVAETGAFGSAAEVLHRTQGAVSYNIAKIEEQLGLLLFERTARKPRLTAAGLLVVRHARAVVGRMDGLRAAARRVGEGVEAHLSLAVDLMLPAARIISLTTRFRECWPTVPLSIRSGVLWDVIDGVLDGDAALGIAGLTALPDSVEPIGCGSVELVAVVAPHHPLAAEDEVDDATLGEHVHLVLSGGDASSALLGVAGGTKWRVTDMGLRVDLLRAGLGWARMPRDRVQADLDAGRLMALTVRRWAGAAMRIEFGVFHHPSRLPGPAAQWVMEEVSEVYPSPGTGPMPS